MNNKEKDLDWINISHKIRETMPVSRMQADVLSFIQSDSFSKIGIACSGGVDSVFLVLFMYAYFGHLRDKFVILHFNHKTRGNDSDDDQAFVEDLAKALKLDYALGCSTEVKHDVVSEEFLRNERHDFFQQTLGELNASALLLGHQKDDITETIIMRLLRGSGLSGLCAPRPIVYFKNQSNRVHLRPLLDISRSELEEAMIKSGAMWREDISNTSTDYFRNKIRHEVVPVLHSISNQDVQNAFSASRQLLEETDDALEFYLNAIYPNNPQEEFDTSFLKCQPKAVVRRVIHKWLIDNLLDGVLKKTAFEDLLNHVITGKSFKVNLLKDSCIVLSENKLRLERLLATEVPVWSEFRVVLGLTLYFPDKSSLKAEYVDLDQESRSNILQGKVDNSFNAYLLVDKENVGDLSVRLWKEGDRYRPIGAPGTRKLKDQFVDRKIPRELRKMLPVICLGGDILWVPGLVPSEHARVFPETKVALRLTYSPFYESIDKNQLLKHE